VAPDARDARGGYGWWRVALVCALLAVVHTWPLATAPGRLCRNDTADTMLNEWILAWIAHQLPRAPAALFDANIFHPARHTLAYSEPLIVPGLLGAPLAWLGASPVLVYNVVLMIGFALTAWAAYAVVKEWTGDDVAGLVAGSAFAFNSHLLTRLAHVQAVHAWGLPLALLAADRIVVSARRRDALWLALWMIAMAATSGYLAVFGVVMIGVVLAARVPEWRTQAGAVLRRFALGAVLTGVITLPLYIVYRQAGIEQGLTRSLDVVAAYSARPVSYLASAGWLHYSTWSEPLFRSTNDAFFPGFAVLALAGVAIWLAITTRRTTEAEARQPRRVVMLIAIALTGFVLSLGPATPIYGWLYRVFPPLQALRGAARFGNLVLLALALLAGLGVASLRRRASSPALAAAAMAMAAIVNIEALRAPLHFASFTGIPSIYSFLAAEPGPVVLAEVPFYRGEAAFENAAYVLNSTAHWRPLMNGYSGLTPRSYVEYAREFWRFPEESAVQAMRRAGVTHLMVHGERYQERSADVWRAIEASPYLERIAVGQGGIALYRVR
jgi:hypothetical protein